MQHLHHAEPPGEGEPARARARRRAAQDTGCLAPLRHAGDADRGLRFLSHPLCPSGNRTLHALWATLAPAVGRTDRRSDSGTGRSAEGHDSRAAGCWPKRCSPRRL